mmetsp:Transcript_107911/g.247381  ORF Transcript_107911/g.247381 Transcript_107911/m.247381 type:complete len:86 (+) Transcript_107911:1129-1386(+)
MISLEAAKTSLARCSNLHAGARTRLAEAQNKRTAWTNDPQFWGQCPCGLSILSRDSGSWVVQSPFQSLIDWAVSQLHPAEASSGS